MYHIWRPKTLHRREQYLAINNADLDSGASPLSADEVQTLQHLLQRFQSSGSDQNNTQFSSAITVSLGVGILFLSCQSFCNSVWNFNLANNFWIVSARTFFWPYDLILEFVLIFGNFNLVYNFSTVSERPLIFSHENYLWQDFSIISTLFYLVTLTSDKIFLLVAIYLSFWPWLSSELAIIGGICVSQTDLVFDFFYTLIYHAEVKVKF